MTRFALAALLATLAACAAPFAHAQPATAQSSLSFNLGAVNDYRYRGISQSRRRPAVQGGVDYSHASGLYIGTWASSIRWVEDAGGSASAEVDVYGGYKFAAGPLGLDVGALRYLYPGSQLGVNPDTTELYAAAKWGPATLKYSHALTNLFGFANSQGSGYLELGATFDTGVWGLSLTPHVGHQRVRRNGDFSYTDVALTLGKDFGNGVSASLALVGTDNDNYRAPNGRNLGKAGAVLGLKVAF
ncbi:MAG TPA: TorF family putative porin [Ramlibacter sp.]|nr:TorF family putative porin [Ramlibacter sp.]